MEVPSSSMRFLLNVYIHKINPLNDWDGGFRWYIKKFSLKHRTLI